MKAPLFVQFKHATSDARMLLVGFVLVAPFLLNTWFARVRCDWRVADYGFALGTFVSPIILATFALSARPRWLGILTASLGFAMSPILAIGIFVSAFGLIFTTVRGTDLSFLPTGELWQGSVRVRAFQTDGGATTDYGLCVRQERRVLPGILLVRDLLNVDHAHGGSLATVAPGVIRVTPNITHQTEKNRPMQLSLKSFLGK